jgi:hypothetical protein
MRKIIFSITLFFIAQQIVAQNFKYGKVSEDDFKTFSTPSDPSDNATVIYKSQDIKFDYRQGPGFVQINEVHERIIIHNKEGFNWATKKIKLYNRSNSNSESLQDLKGYTYNFEGGKIEKEKLKKNGVFEEIANKYWKYSTFTMPNIKEGSIIEYVYEIASPYLQIDDIEFQYSIPINQFDLTIKTPEYFIYNKLTNPRASYSPRLETIKKNRTISIRNNERKVVDFSISNTSKLSKSELKLFENIITSNSSNIPALKEEPLVDNIDNYRSKLILELTAIKYPNEPYKSLSSNWDDVTKTIYKDEDFGEQLDKTSYFEDDLNAVISGETDDIKKTHLIYNFVKSKVKWNGFYGFTTENGVRKAYKEGVGNTADINIMLISMLRSAGIRANPVLVSTKNNGIPLFPTRQGFNYVVCLIENADFNSFLDATERYSTFNILPTRTLNWQGRVIRENGSSTWIDLLATTVSNESTSLNVKINPDLTIEGKVRDYMTDYLAQDYRNKFANISEDDHIKYLESNNGEIVIENVEFKNNNNPLEPIQLTYEYQLSEGIEEIGDKLYFSPMLFLASTENPFTQETRKYPIAFNYPVASKYIINIMLPEGYIVDTLPISEASEFNTGSGKFSYIIKENGNYLQLTVNLDLNMTLILPKNYESFKKFNKQMIEKQTEKVVLKKI